MGMDFLGVSVTRVEFVSYVHLNDHQLVTLLTFYCVRLEVQGYITNIKMIKEYPLSLIIVAMTHAYFQLDLNSVCVRAPDSFTFHYECV